MFEISCMIWLILGKVLKLEISSLKPNWSIDSHKRTSFSTICNRKNKISYKKTGVINYLDFVTNRWTDTMRENNDHLFGRDLVGQKEIFHLFESHICVKAKNVFLGWILKIADEIWLVTQIIKFFTESGKARSCPTNITYIFSALYATKDFSNVQLKWSKIYTKIYVNFYWK